MRFRAAVALVLLGSVWGSSFLFIKVIVDEIAPLELVVGRLALGTLAVWPVLLYRRLPLRRSPTLLAKVAVLALLGMVAPFALIAWAEVHIDSGVASVLNSAMPLWTSLFAAAVLLEERMTVVRAAGLSVGFVGVIVLTGGDIWRVTENDVLGQLAVVGASMCYGASAVFARTLLRSEEPLSLSAIQLAIATALTIPIALAVEGTPDVGALSAKGALALLPLGVLATGLGYIAYLWLVDNTGSVRASLVTYIVPVVGLLLGWAVLDEGIGINTLVGAVLIIAGVATVVSGEAPTAQRVVPVAAPAD